MNITSHSLRLLGKAELPEAIEEGNNYHVSLEGSVISSSVHDNENGEWSKVYTFKPIKIELLDPKGKSIKLKDARKNSQKLRNYLFKLYANEGIVQPFDAVYDAATLEMLSLMPQILREAVKRLEI